MSEEIFDQVATHLELLGYELDRKERSIYARHPDKANLFVRPYSTGVIVSTYYVATEQAKEDRLSFLEYTNKANYKCSIIQYFLDDDSDLNMVGVYSGEYSRIAFGRFLTAWYKDHDILVGFPETAEYFK